LKSLEITSKTQVYGLIGDPVDHSISPIIQNAAFARCGLDAVYLVFQVKSTDLKPAISGASALSIRGLNVTVPHKIRVMRYIDSFDREALKIGSVNTIINREGASIGFNTDGKGALRSVGVERLRGSSVLLLGAGGAARAIAYTFAPEARKIRIVNRTISSARQLRRALVRRYRCKITSAPLTIRRMKEFVEAAELIVNASSMGMDGRNDLPIKRDWLRSNQTVFDIVYDPPITTLLKNARSAGAQTIDGLEMLLNQGAISFSLWTGKDAPIAEMRRALSQKLMDHGDD